MGRNSVKKIKKAPRYSARASVLHLENEDDLFDLIERTENPLILLLEGVPDPHNLGGGGCARASERRMQYHPYRARRILWWGR